MVYGTSILCVSKTSVIALSSSPPDKGSYCFCSALLEYAARVVERCAKNLKQVRKAREERIAATEHGT